ncbi:TIR domain-containing protein [Lentzea flava]|uniref:TIR domain-containing protein n=1 Tax=Lentzea flava TaxID=103732 RepID=A0ABQ2UJ07_9PSEU|nr:TIR domain-containing protein [Lentzea flava]MCP2199914.1 TIR domain-containing protein [Lentzea flava]GGU40001.1 hypothetical protein GCM10010178_35480 [Lentzea flava]
MSGYLFDFFISYSRQGSVQKWLLNHFYNKLVECLADECAPAPRVYMDRHMPRAVDWSHNLRTSLRHSKIMIQVMTPHYFRSGWCMSELQSMRAREEMLGFASAKIPQGLIYPIVYSDCEDLRDEERMRKWHDFKEYAHPDPVYQQTVEYIHFHKEVKQLARDLVELASWVPDWQEDWPIVELPDPIVTRRTPLPRFEPCPEP